MNFKLVSIAVTVHFKEVEVENVTLFAARLQFFLLLFDVSHYVRLQVAVGAQSKKARFHLFSTVYF